ncbi:pentatricopeptide repeat-containing protein At1g05670, mitochondrial-like [Carya illinoinensis]|uniref:pentatricopeptide repeat-containing protein At1g05670, mitochondrial-like n=1 Tax=Carya illinoinensis TaxID=32201 RepID=UPI001C719CD4|nr:pentatricopeptide repeat-containing protein At1g05670, mitochondrial-like [Carya illinoinensis]
MHKAKKFMDECLNKGCAVNVVNFTTIIHGFCQKNDLVVALSLLDDMYLSNKHPDAITFTTLIDALGKKGRMEDGFGNLEEADKLLGNALRTTSKIDAKTCHIVMEAYLNNGIPLSAYKVAFRMFNWNLIPNLKLCEKGLIQTILNGYSIEKMIRSYTTFSEDEGDDALDVNEYIDDVDDLLDYIRMGSFMDN